MIQLGGRSYIIFSLTWYPMKLVRTIKVCVNETYSRVWVENYLSDMFLVMNGLKQGDDLLPLLFNSSLEYILVGFR
jgi:hypothetical protein